MCHIYVRADGLACVLTADHEYPQRVAHTLLTKVLAIRKYFFTVQRIDDCFVRFLMIFLDELHQHSGQKEMLLLWLTLALKDHYPNIKILEKQMP
jgi:hypothetical protein